MAFDAPEYPGERRIPLSDYTVTGVSSDQAIDGDAVTFQLFSEVSTSAGIQAGGATEAQRGRLVFFSNGPGSGGSWYSTTLQPITRFTTRFLFRILPGSGARGLCFVVQNAGINVIGTGGPGLCYQGTPQSVALKFDVQNGSDNYIGLFTGGQLPAGGVPISPSLINFDDGYPIEVNISYDGVTLTVDVRHTVHGRGFSHSWPIDIPDATNATIAYPGFSASTEGPYDDDTPNPVEVWEWSYQGEDAPPSITVPPLRFLRVDWGDDRFITRVRLKASGPGAPNLGIAFESSLGLAEQDGVPPAPEVPIPHIPLWGNEDIFAVELTVPLLARGVVLYPDYLFDLGISGQENFPEVFLYELQVYEIYNEGNTSMPLPVVKRSRVGVQAVSLYPWNGPTGPYDATTASDLAGLNELGLSKASKSAQVTGGETVHVIGAFETSRETKVKVSHAKSDLRVLAILLGGSFQSIPAAGNLGEIQYYSENLGDRAPYFRLKAKSTNGDGADSFVFPKLRVDGNITFNLTKDQVTNLEFEAIVVWDDTYVRQDGAVGGIFEQLFGAKGETELHS